MRAKYLALGVLIGAVTVVAGCSSKKPQTSADLATAPVVAPAPTPQTTDVSASVRPATGEDKSQVDPLKDPDLARLNSFVLNQGLLGDVYFDFDRYELKQDARNRLAKNADWLKSHGEFLLTIEGHCDERGTNEYNLALGERRAAAARDYILSLGVASARVKIISYGEERPVCRESNEGCWAQNRRAHFLVTGRTHVG